MSSIELKQYKLARLKHFAQQYGLDLLIASLHENISYMTDFICVGGTMLHRTQTYAVLDLKTDIPALIIGYGEAAAAYEKTGCCKYYCYGAFNYDRVKDPDNASKIIYQMKQECFVDAGEALKQAIHDCGMKKGKIGLDESIVTIQIWEDLKSTFPQFEFIPAASVFNEARKIKHPEEILYLERAAEIAEQSILAVVKDMHVGMTERELEARFNQEVYTLGALPFFCVATIDARSANVDTVNTDLSLTKNSHVRFDLGCNYKGYKSDISRTVAIGSSIPKICDMYQWIQEGEAAAIDSIRPGVTCEEVFHTAVTTVKKGIPAYRRHHCGHGIGLEIYDMPSIAPGVTDEIQENQVFCIETPYYILGWGGIQVEDTVQVTSDGTYCLTKTSKSLIKIQL